MQLLINSGKRQFLFPPAINGRSSHEWSFLKPVTTMTTSGAYSTGTVSITQGAKTLAIDGVIGTWPSWVDSDAEFLYDGTYYAVASVLGNNITMVDNWVPATLTNEDDWTLVRRKYTMPDAFGGIDGPLTFNEYTSSDVVKVTGESRVRMLNQWNTTTGRPQLCAVRWKYSDSTAGHRAEMIFWPTPDSAYILYYRYLFLPDALDASNLYHLGGMAHSETLLESCLAVAEMRKNDERGIHWARFLELLQTSIDYDLRSMSAESLGYMGDPGMETDRSKPFYRNCVVSVTTA